MDITGRMIAYYRACETQYPESERLFSDPYAEAFVSQEVVDFAREMTEAMPSLQSFIRLRTRCIDDCITELATAESQIVIVGAGADARACRMRLPTKYFYELDLLGSAREKIDALKNRFQLDVCHVNYVESNLNEDSLYGVMTRADFCPDRHTVFVFEGVIMYLSDEANERILNDMNMLMKTAYHIIYYYAPKSVVTRTTGEDEITNHADALERHGYRFYSGVDDIESYAVRFGVSVIKDMSITEVQEKYAPHMPFPKGCGEYFHVAVLTRDASISPRA